MTDRRDANRDGRDQLLRDAYASAQSMKRELASLAILENDTVLQTRLLEVHELVEALLQHIERAQEPS